MRSGLWTGGGFSCFSTSLFKKEPPERGRIGRICVGREEVGGGGWLNEE